jgi:glutamate-1-semialdehyde 2,1-aminomutase
MSQRYSQSEELLARAEQTIPLGSQTFSKSRTQFPYGVSPYFIQRGHGSHVWDVDGNQYIDFINALAAITLGYSDPDVNAAVRAQLEEGVIFSLPHPIEIKVAEKIREVVPGAERVRFAKNGSDATAGSVRLARAFTKRDHVAVCGYHGWQDWYIGSTARNLGVPKSTRDLTHSFLYNDLPSLEKIFREHHKEVAAVILEPMNVYFPKDGFLEKVKELSHREGALLIFDETITGFRLSLGGAQELFGVTPDLSTFGKGLANGFPLSAIVGKAEIMRLMEDIFFSFTFGGEALSLAAAYATITKLQREPVIPTLKAQGKKIVDRANALIVEFGLQNVLSVSGDPAWSFLLIQDVPPHTQFAIKTLLMQELFARGILSFGTHNMSYTHGDVEVDHLIKAYAEVFAIIREAVFANKLEMYLRCAPLQPLFKVR